MSGVLLAWLVEIGVIGVRDLAASHRLPYPSELLASFVIFGTLGVIADNQTARPVANVTAWGLVVATFLSSRVDFLKPVGDFLGGSTGQSQQQAQSLMNPIPAPKGAA